MIEPLHGTVPALRGGPRGGGGELRFDLGVLPPDRSRGLRSIARGQGASLPASNVRHARLTFPVGAWPKLRTALRAESSETAHLVRSIETSWSNYCRTSPRELRLAQGRVLRVGGRTLVMGVINATPDSFYDGGRHASAAAAVSHGLRLCEEGADLLDIGGESTRPGSRGVSARVEMRRILPVVRELSAHTKVPLSIDTCKAEVAQEALKAGAHLVNDVTGLTDPKMREVVRGHGAGAVVMHMRGRPRDMQQNIRYRDLRGEVFHFLDAQTVIAEKEGIGEDQLVVDPGIGFGKSFEGNLDLLDHIAEFRSLGYPVLVGASRKSFLGALLGGAPPEGRLHASVAAAVLASQRGAEMVRVHDVAETVQALRVADALRVGRPGARLET